MVVRAISVPRIVAATLACLWAGSCDIDPEMQNLCDLYRKNCGEVVLPSGRIITCGTCGPYEVCSTDGFEGTCCVPTSCEEQGVQCGTMPDGCGGVVECGECPEGESCGGRGTANTCGLASCEPTSCAASAVECGLVSDGCAGVLDCGGCPLGQTCGGGGSAHVCGAARTEAPPATLAEGCFDWPDLRFSPTNFTPLTLGLGANNPSVDFTLADVRGQRFSLSELLEEGPVLLELGSFTCPVFEGNEAAINDIAEEYAGRLRVVTIFTVEAHPAPPDHSPFRGLIWPLAYSQVPQPRTYSTRRALAARLQAAGDRLVLVDGVRNGVWCTYGPAANPAFLIRRDGRIAVAQLWFDPSQMRREIDRLLAD